MEGADGVVMGKSCGEPACIFAPRRPGGRYGRAGLAGGTASTSFDSLLREADAALYAAQQAGRDRVGRAIAEPALA